MYPPSDQPLELLHLLNLSQCSLPAGRLLRWAAAFQAWIARRRSPFSRNTGQVSYTAWREFLAFTRKSPWEATTADVEAYIVALEQKKAAPRDHHLPAGRPVPVLQILPGKQHRPGM